MQVRIHPWLTRDGLQWYWALFQNSTEIKGNLFIKFGGIWIGHLFPKKTPFFFLFIFKTNKQTKHYQRTKNTKRKPRSHEDMSTSVCSRLRKVFKYFPLISILTRLWVRMRGLQSVKMKRSNSAFSRDTEYLIKSWICRIQFFAVFSSVSPFALC